MWVSSHFQTGKDKCFNAFFDTVAIYLTVLEKEQHKNIYNTKNMQHFLQPRFSGEHVKENTCLPLF